MNLKEDQIKQFFKNIHHWTVNMYVRLDFNILSYKRFSKYQIIKLQWNIFKSYGDSKNWKNASGKILIKNYKEQSLKKRVSLIKSLLDSRTSILDKFLLINISKNQIRNSSFLM